MRRPIRLLAGIAVLAAVLGFSQLIGGMPAQAAAGATVWKIDCAYSHTSADDPIVFPGQPGAAHLHDFYGNASTNANSTYESMRGVKSTCVHNDRGAYWTPVLYRNGKMVHSDGQIVYYDLKAYKAQHVEAFPPGFKMIVGNKSATTAAEQSSHVYWACEDTSRVDYSRREPPDYCSPSTGIQLRVEFPSCWDGVAVAGNAIDHMGYPSGGNCPKGYPHVFPMIGFHATYQFHDATTGNITFSSGNVYSAHVDFWNTWDQKALQTLIDDCSNGQNPSKCGHFTGRATGSPGKEPGPLPAPVTTMQPMPGMSSTPSTTTPGTTMPPMQPMPGMSSTPSTTMPPASPVTPTQGSVEPAVATGVIVGAGSRRCMSSGAANKGVQMSLSDCTGGTNQLTTQTSAGEFRMAGRCLDAQGAGRSAGTKVILWDCNGQANQQWIRHSNGSITGQDSGLCVDALKKGTANGTRIAIWSCNGGSNQQWSTSGSGSSAIPATPVTITPASPVTTPPVPSQTGGATGPFSIPANLGAHDPSRVINDHGKYFFYSTGGNIPGWYSSDGANWSRTPAILPQGIPAAVHAAVPTNDGRDVWAPDVIWNPNSKVFDLYYAVADWDNDSRSAIGLTTSPTLDPSSPKYHWTDHGVVIAKTPSANAFNAIDPAPFFDASGEMWMSLGSGYASTRNTAINVIALNKNTGMRSDSAVHVLQSCGCEASYVQYHAGYYYLFWNTGGCCSGAASSYLIHVARSTNVTGPYTGNRDFFASTGSIHGPGQIGVISQGGKDYYTFHYYPSSGGSVMGLGTMQWGSDGWPVR